MNKNIFSLVCIILYTLLAVSIHCSEQKSDRSKTSGLRSRVIRAIQKIKRSNKKNDIEPQQENQSNNNNKKNRDHEIIDSITYYSDQYKKTRYRHTTCCGLFTEYRYPHTSYYSHSARD
ncbi:fam-c protein [Plasmodium vinckei vinckei]|uniref:Fam-c protein n=1 Tax=Plasmodium vinckei vinckei TaxID=54757 RepID=A0A449BMA5_PLAVN|nr:fam-c protein [Plasmodium vinckei vinckei]VEV54545.1 fam-c protein [Plasmodium vinckei vinckei]